MKGMLTRISVSLLIAGLTSSPAIAVSELSRASAHSSVGLSMVTGSVVVGSVQTVAGASELIVEGIEKVGEGTVFVLKNVSTGVKVSVQTAGASVGTASVALGTVFTVVTDASGHAIMASGKMIAFIPNEVGKSLIHSRRSLDREGAR